MEKEVLGDDAKKLIADYANKIGRCLHRSVKEILNAGVYAAEAVKKIPKGRKLLAKSLLVSDATLSKWVQIGKDTRLRKNIENLPPSYSTLYAISKLRTRN
jgi:hypothetical protein